jgi:hypothetical protein
MEKPISQNHLEPKPENRRFDPPTLHDKNKSVVKDGAPSGGVPGRVGLPAKGGPPKWKRSTFWARALSRAGGPHLLRPFTGMGAPCLRLGLGAPTLKEHADQGMILFHICAARSSTAAAALRSISAFTMASTSVSIPFRLPAPRRPATPCGWECPRSHCWVLRSPAGWGRRC